MSQHSLCFKAHKDAVRCGNARKKHWRMSKWVIIALSNRLLLLRDKNPPLRQFMVMHQLLTEGLCQFAWQG